MRSRSTLHKSRLAAFQSFCEANGWEVEACKGPYEILRMRHADRRAPLIVHDRIDAKEHYTTWGESAHMVKRFIRAARAALTPQEQK